MLERFGVYKLSDDKTARVVLLSYPGIEANGTVIVAPLLREHEIAHIEILHPIVSVSEDKYILAMERMTAIPSDVLGELMDSVLRHEYEIMRAHGRLFDGT